MPIIAIKSVFKRRKGHLRYYDITFFYEGKNPWTFELRTANEDERSRLNPQLSGNYFYGEFAIPVSEEDATAYIKAGRPLPEMIISKSESNDSNHPYADIGGHSHDTDNRGGHNDHGGAGGNYNGDGTHDTPHDHVDHDAAGNDHVGGGHNH